MADPTNLSCVRLQTARLVLREFGVDDAEAIQAYAGDPEVTRYTSWGPNSPDDTATVLAGWVAARGSVPRTEFTLAM